MLFQIYGCGGIALSSCQVLSDKFGTGKTFDPNVKSTFSVGTSLNTTLPKTISVGSVTLVPKLADVKE
jgi:hypothetical protein